ncbi:MAG: amino acid permease [Pirellulales bacterium]|nr:amino acid permease [Pirellulales bacterium]
MTLWKQLLSRKSIETLLAEMAGEHRLRRVLGPFSLTAIGVGAIIGAGIFVMTGRAAAQDAGPAVVASYMVAAFGCGLAALCYAEFAAMAPVAGSAYTYAYATLGEILAWIIGWDLILEYGMSCATVAAAWSHYLNELLLALGLPLVGPGLSLDPFTHSDKFGSYLALNFPALGIMVLVTTILVIGIRESATANAILVLVKLVVVLFVIAIGVSYIDPANWTSIPVDAAGQASHDANRWGLLGVLGIDRWLQPLDEMIRSPFAPYGLSGLMLGASIVFFAYIGFDAISTHAEEAHNPQRDMPIGILVSLGLCTLLYVGVAAVITGMVPYHKIDIGAPIAAAFSQRAAAENSALLRGATALIATGALAGMTSVLLITFQSQVRIFLAMARDGLLPPAVAEVHPKYQTPHLTTIVTGILISVIAATTPIEKLGEMVNIGTLLAFVIVCFSVLLLRRQRPDAVRPFRCPVIWLVAPTGIVVNVIMMLFLPLDTWIRLVVWLVIGLVIYFLYGRHHSTLGQRLWREFSTQGLSPTDAPLPRD